MQQTPAGSFFRFVFGFLLFIGLSFGITVAVSSRLSVQDVQQQAAAAQAKMLSGK